MTACTRKKVEKIETEKAAAEKSGSDNSSKEDVVLTEAQIWELVHVADEIKAVGRLNTTQAFELGAQLARG